MIERLLRSKKYGVDAVATIMGDGILLVQVYDPQRAAFGQYARTGMESARTIFERRSYSDVKFMFNYGSNLFTKDYKFSRRSKRPELPGTAIGASSPP